MGSTKHIGTTLAILAPYLPYNVQVETGCGPCYIMSIDLTGTESCPIEVMTVEDCENGEGPLEYYDFESVLPILFGFSDLCTATLSNKIPAIEIAKHVFEEPDFFYTAKYYSRKATGGFAKAVVTAKETKSGKDAQVLTIYEGWGAEAAYIDEDGAESSMHVNAAGFVNKCRELYLAVGLESSQYVRKKA